jgi:putative N6-adenine-specific DNA methylase
MIARNIAPGIGRHFRIESLPCFEREVFEAVKNSAKTRSYPTGQYQIYAEDIDEEIIEKAKRNAHRAHV